MMTKGPIYWHQGLFLQPQHFQIMDRRVLETLEPLLAGLNPFFWGIASGGMNEAALETGRVELGTVSLLFPSTAVMIRCPGNAVSAGRQIPAGNLPVDGSVTVYAGIRAEKPGEPSVTIAGTPADMAAAATRMATPVEPETISDAYSDGPAAGVQHLYYILNLVFDHELERAGDLELMPVARLTRQGDSFAIDGSFAPPCLTLAASPVLSATLKEIRDRILGKARQLEGYKNLSGLGGESADYAVLLMALRALALFSARLDQAVAHPTLSPWDAYGTLRELVAELSVFSLEIGMLGEDWQDEKLVPDYDHTDLGACFQSARNVIVKLLDGISAGPRFVTAFEYHDPYWTAGIPRQILEETKISGEFWLVLSSGTSAPQELRDSASRMLKLSATAAMGSLLMRALPGIPLSASDGPPAGMPRRQGALYFRIGRESSLWQDVERSGALSMHWPDAPGDLEAQLAVLAR